MRLKKVFIENFRCYKDRTEITFENITSMIGRNDAGKSTILEALDIFFNDSKGVVKLDNDDANVCGGSDIITIEAVFDKLPEELIVDTSVATSLQEEYLVNSDGDLHIIKKYRNGKNISISLLCNYPDSDVLPNLHSTTIKDLQKLVDLKGIGVEDKRVSSLLRKAIFDYHKPFSTSEKIIEVKKEGSKQIWDSLQKYVPIYSLFQTDRKNEDKDSEIQDPMNAAIKEILEEDEIQELLDKIFKKVKETTEDVANHTLEKLAEMNPDLASELVPNFETPKWNSIFKCGLMSDLNIPINKRGSGVRRLILLNFFRAKVERNRNSLGNSNVIYAFEEPETALHPDQQKMLIESFLELSNNENTQIIFTTHSPGIGKMIPVESLRFIRKENIESKIDKPSDDSIEKIVETLGVFPEISIKDIDTVKVALCVEGKNDIDFIKRLNSNIEELKDIVDLNSNKVIILPLGGSTLKFWVNNKYLNKLNLAQVHIYDSDKGSSDPHKYKAYIEKINQEERCKAFETRCKEMENYITPDILASLENFDVSTFNDQEWETFDVPEAYAKYKHINSESEIEWKDLKEDKKRKKVSQAKVKINTELVEMLTKEKLCNYGLYEEVKDWFEAIKSFI